MAEPIANIVVSMPSQLFTAARSFKALANGRIYLGKIDTDPTQRENQIAVYMEREDGKLIQVSQPIIVNAAGYPVYNGQITKFVTVEGHSMAVYDSANVQQFYFPDVLKYDPGQFEKRISESLGIYTKRYASVSSMKSDSFPKNGDVVETLGYYKKGDGGSASYTLVSGEFVEDGFIYHKAKSGFWKLNPSESGRYDIRIAGVVGDGRPDDTSAFISSLKLPIFIGDMSIILNSEIDINKLSFLFENSTSINIEGIGRSSKLIFKNCNGFIGEKFFRYLKIHRVQIINPNRDKKYLGLWNSEGAENIDLQDVEFVNFKVGYDVHAWVSTLVRCRSVGCLHSGFINGTSITTTSLYSDRCDFGNALGLRYSRARDSVEISPWGVSYALMTSSAADECGVPYLFGGSIKNVTLLSCGAEATKGEYIFDFERLSRAQPRNNAITIDKFDIYVEDKKSDALIAIAKSPLKSSPSRNKSIVKIRNSSWYSDYDIPAFSGDGSGVDSASLTYNRRLTSSSANELIVDGVGFGDMPVGFPGSLISLGGFANIQKANGLFFVPENTARLIIPIHANSDPYRTGITLFGNINIYPVNKSGVNADRQSGTLLISLSSDFPQGLAVVNTQKYGNLSRFSCATRLKGGIQELVVTISSTVDSMFETSIFSNGSLPPETKRWYLES